VALHGLTSPSSQFAGMGGEHPPSQMRPATPSRNHGGEQLRPRRRRQRKSRQSTTLHQPIRVSTASHQSVRPPEVTSQRVGPWSPRAHNEQPRRRNPDAGSLCRAISSDSANGSSVGTPTDARVFPRCERLHTLALDEKKSTSISRFIKTNLGEVSVAGQGVE
jgi:hypothetical protein